MVPQSFITTLSLVRGAGQLLVLGASREAAPIVEATLIPRETDIKASLAYTGDEIHMCLDFLAQRRFNTDGFISDIISLDDVVRNGFERLASSTDLVKVLIAPWRMSKLILHPGSI